MKSTILECSKEDFSMGAGPSKGHIRMMAVRLHYGQKTSMTYRTYGYSIKIRNAFFHEIFGTNENEEQHRERTKSPKLT